MFPPAFAQVKAKANAFPGHGWPLLDVTFSEVAGDGTAEIPVRARHEREPSELGIRYAARPARWRSSFRTRGSRS